MFWRLVFSSLFLLGISARNIHSRGSSKGAPKKFTMVETWRSEPKDGRHGPVPDELEITLSMEGQQDLNLQLKSDPKMTNPPGLAAKTNDQLQRQTPSDQSATFFSDVRGQGSFACVSSGNQAQTSCDMMGLVHYPDQLCMLFPGSETADCITRDAEDDPDTLDWESPPDMSEEEPLTVTSGGRRRRTTPYPEPGYKVVELAFIVDQKFMEPFYGRHTDGQTGEVDVVSAETEANTFITLFSAELNVYFQSLNTVTAGELDLYVYPAAFLYPEDVDGSFYVIPLHGWLGAAAVTHGSDFSWSGNYNDGVFLYSNKTLASEVRDLVNSGTIDQTFEHAVVITGFNLRNEGTGTGLLGYTWIRTVCTTSKNVWSMNEFYRVDVTRIVAHEIGHALGAPHDNTDECPSGRNIMSPGIFALKDPNVDTYHSFSNCSAASIIAHLESKPDCTANHGFTASQFRAAFCAGMLGQETNSLDKQCQKETGWAGSVACNSIVSDEGCYQQNTITCQEETGACGKTLKFVWNGTPCGVDKYCYKGLCVTAEETCAVAPCNCCDVSGKAWKDCCDAGKSEHNADCYCCGELRRISPY